MRVQFTNYPLMVLPVDLTPGDIAQIHGALVGREPYTHDAVTEVERLALLRKVEEIIEQFSIPIIEDLVTSAQEGQS